MCQLLKSAIFAIFGEFSSEFANVRTSSFGLMMMIAMKVMMVNGNGNNEYNLLDKDNSVQCRQKT